MRNAEAIFADEDRRSYDTYRYSPAVKVGRYVNLSGVIGVDGSGQVPADLRAELNVAFKTIERLLVAAGTTFDQVVSLDSFHVTSTLSEDLRAFNEVRATYMAAPHPAWTAVAVSGLAIPSARIEIKVTAYLDPAAG